MLSSSNAKTWSARASAELPPPCAGRGLRGVCDACTRATCSHCWQCHECDASQRTEYLEALVSLPSRIGTHEIELQDKHDDEHHLVLIAALFLRRLPAGAYTGLGSLQRNGDFFSAGWHSRGSFQRHRQALTSAACDVIGGACEVSYGGGGEMYVPFPDA